MARIGCSASNGGRMKARHLLALTAFLGLGASLMATPACATSPILVTSAVTCEIGNLIFSNFTLTGSPDTANLTVTYGITNLADTNYIVNFNDSNDMTSSFGVSYTVTVDQTTPPATDDGNEAITIVGGGTQADGTSSNNVATLTKTVTAITGTGSGSFTVVQTGAINTNNGPLTGLADKSATIGDSFAYTSGGFQNLSNSFTEADTSLPEPSSLLLMGLGLSAAGLISRRRFTKRP